MSGLIEQLAQIRERQGKDPLPDPRHIQGFGPNDAPAPSYTEQRLAEATGRDDFDDDEPAPPPMRQPEGAARAAPRFSQPQVSSPLIPQPPTMEQALDNVDLVVVGEQASYKGRGCILNEREKAGVVAVVLQALKRSIRDQLRELSSMKPRRRKRATVSNVRSKKP